jgi:cytoskeleton protein RodZ
MSELNLTGSPMDDAHANELGGLTAGEILRNAREVAGLHIAALAFSMKIPVKKLEALENDRLDLLHDAVFVRALAASVCRSLKIDQAPVLAKLPLNSVPRLNSVEGGINQPFHPAGDRNALSLPSVFTKPQTLLVCFLLAGIVAVFFMPQDKLVDHTSDLALQMPKVVQQHAPPSSGIPEASANDAVVAPSAVSISDKDQVGTTAITSQAVGNTVSAPISLDINGVASGAGTSRSSTIVFKAKAASWVKVVDSAGVVQLSKILADGEVASVSGSEPLSIVVGRADVVDVEVRGKAFNMTAFAKENVARFEVK